MLVQLQPEFPGPVREHPRGLQEVRLVRVRVAAGGVCVPWLAVSLTGCAGRTPAGGAGATPRAGATRPAGTCRPPGGSPATPGPTGPADTPDRHPIGAAHWKSFINLFGQFEWPVGIGIQGPFPCLDFLFLSVLS